MPVEFSISEPSIEPLQCELLTRARVTMNVLRLDRCHPLLTGNKWYKLKYNLLEFQKRPELPILSFGGAYSNHLHALAAAGKYLGMETIGVLRGELPEPLNPVLSFALEQGMTLHPVSRVDYRRRQDPDFIQELRAKFGEFHLLPEGGSNALAITGCEEIAALLRWQNPGGSRLLALCCGTGTTAAGLISGLSKEASESAPQLLGVSVLKGDGYLQREIKQQLTANGCVDAIGWRVDDQHHCGGYARSNPALSAFMTQFAQYSDVPLEPVYSGKLFFALFDLIERGEIAPGTEVLAIHTGGIHT
ncbi:MAG: 1-aminocyclopropane-1-carboxylate deaminase [Pseudohongiella sp.]|nr:MAG: 1-aminocyclopropane-1-carboxylate deaminase [Pseudohongiella sp.]